jgi:hypothetical protein
VSLRPKRLSSPCTNAASPTGLPTAGSRRHRHSHAEASRRLADELEIALHVLVVEEDLLRAVTALRDQVLPEPLRNLIFGRGAAAPG